MDAITRGSFMEIKTYKIDDLIEKFNEHSLSSKKDQKIQIEDWKKNYPSEPIPEWFMNDFNISEALLSMCQEIKKLDNKVYKMNWIPVKDKLPNDCEPVLIYCSQIKSMTVAFLVYDLEGKPKDFTIVDFDEYDQSCSLKNISHWMELPKPPDEENLCGYI